MPSPGATHPLRERVDRLPTLTGVYLMKDARGSVLYVGKAINLRARVRSYFTGGDGRPRLPLLLGELARIDISLAATEREALLLEARLIRQYQPRYNVALKHGGRPRALRLDFRTPFPRLEARPPAPDGARYFGPLPSSWHTEGLLELLESQFPLRTCDDWELTHRTRPCLRFQLRRCPAPCVGLIDAEGYHRMLEGVLEVLQGGESALAGRVREEMQTAAERLEFERAAWLRDRLGVLDGLRARRWPPVPGEDRDVIGLARLAEEVAVAVLPVRGGRQQEAQVFTFTDPCSTDEELLATFVLQHYGARADENTRPDSSPAGASVATSVGAQPGPPKAVSPAGTLASGASWMGTLLAPARLVLPRASEGHWDSLQEALEAEGVTLSIQDGVDDAGLHEIARAAAESELAAVTSDEARWERGLEQLGGMLRVRPGPERVAWWSVDWKAQEARLIWGALNQALELKVIRWSLKRMEAGAVEAVWRMALQRLGPATEGIAWILEGSRADVERCRLAAVDAGRSGDVWLAAINGEARRGARRGRSDAAQSPADAPGPGTAPETRGVESLPSFYLAGRRNPLKIPGRSPLRWVLERLHQTLEQGRAPA